jgi:hypothetical protein
MANKFKVYDSLCLELSPMIELPEPEGGCNLDFWISDEATQACAQ